MKQGRRKGLTVLQATSAVAALTGLLMLPGAVKLAGRKTASLDGIVTITGAITACRRSGLFGWDLVAYAQRLVAAKFAIYTVWNLWDTPARAFAFGMGYCTQYNLALKEILDALGFDVQAVSSSRVAVSTKPEWRLGHTWLRVRLGDRVRDVCAGDLDNAPGKVHFTAIKPVWQGNRLVFLLTHLGMMLFVGGIGWKAWLTRRPAPAWTYAIRP